MSSGDHGSMTYSVPGPFCNPGPVLRGLAKNGCLAILRLYGTVWQNLVKDPTIQVFYHLRLIFVLKLVRAAPILGTGGNVGN